MQLFGVDLHLRDSGDVLGQVPPLHVQVVGLTHPQLQAVPYPYPWTHTTPIGILNDKPATLTNSQPLNPPIELHKGVPASGQLQKSASKHRVLLPQVLHGVHSELHPGQLGLPRAGWL